MGNRNWWLHASILQVRAQRTDAISRFRRGPVRRQRILYRIARWLSVRVEETICRHSRVAHPVEGPTFGITERLPRDGDHDEQISDTDNWRHVDRTGYTDFSMHDASGYKSRRFPIPAQEFRESRMQPGLQANQRAFVQLLKRNEMIKPGRVMASHVPITIHLISLNKR